MPGLLFALLAAMLLTASCAQGVPVPADFPVKISLPAGSEITSNPGMDIAKQAGGAMNMKMVDFKCSGGAVKVQKHITTQLKGKGYEKMVLPGMGNITGNDTFSKEGSNLMISFSNVGGDNYMLMSMEMPDMSSFKP